MGHAKVRVKVLVGGLPVAGLFYDRLASITITDQEGVDSDKVVLELFDGDYGIAMPQTGAPIVVFLALAGTPLVQMGIYTVTDRGGSGPVRMLTITGKALDMASTARGRKAEGREDRTIGQLAGEVASGAGLQPVVSASIRDVPVKFVGQQGESDLHMLARLTRPYDVTVKAADGKLVVVKRGEGLDASGQPIIPFLVTPSMLTDWSWSLGERETTGEVSAEWRDQPGAEVRRETAQAGSGPDKRLRTVWGSQQEAQLAAKGEADAAKRAPGSFQGTGTFMPYLFAGGRALLAGFKPGLPLLWHVQSVTHTLQGSSYLGTSFTAQLSGEGDGGAAGG